MWFASIIFVHHHQPFHIFFFLSFALKTTHAVSERCTRCLRYISGISIALLCIQLIWGTNDWYNNNNNNKSMRALKKKNIGAFRVDFWQWINFNPFDTNFFFRVDFHYKISCRRNSSVLASNREKNVCKNACVFVITKGSLWRWLQLLFVRRFARVCRKLVVLL